MYIYVIYVHIVHQLIWVRLLEAVCWCITGKWALPTMGVVSWLQRPWELMGSLTASHFVTGFVLFYTGFMGIGEFQSKIWGPPQRTSGG